MINIYIYISVFVKINFLKSYLNNNKLLDELNVKFSAIRT